MQIKKKTIESLLPLLRVEANSVAITVHVMDIRNSVIVYLITATDEDQSIYALVKQIHFQLSDVY